MLLLPIHTPVIQKGDDLAAILLQHASFLPGDILVLSSKVIATAEGAAIALDSLTVTEEAMQWSAKTGCNAAFMQAVLTETQRLHGIVKGYCKGALLTELQPDGLTIGTIFAPNAGMDASNIGKGFAVGWPIDPVQSIRQLQANLSPSPGGLVGQEGEGLGVRQIAIIISDSCCRPRRLGVTAFALTCCGLDPHHSEIGNADLFGNTMTLTVESTADQLATAANILMGNAAQSIPAVIIRDHALPFSDFCGWVDGMKEEEDLFGEFGESKKV